MAAVSFSFLQFLQCFDSADCVTARPSGSSYDQMPLLSPSRTKKQPMLKVGGDQIHLVPTIFIVGGDASHGVAAAMYLAHKNMCHVMNYPQRFFCRTCRTESEVE